MADFVAGYISGAIGLLIGNPLDVLKTRLQASTPASAIQSPAATSLDARPRGSSSHGQYLRIFSSSDAFRGVAVPVLTYGALNAVLFATYNRSLGLLCPLPANSPTTPPQSALVENNNVDNSMLTAYPYWAHFASGCLAGLATFVISAPTEVVKCRAQVAISSSNGAPQRVTSWQVARDLWHERGLPGLYHGGVVTALRDGIGYGFYYLTYECSKDLWDRMLVADSVQDQQQGQASNSAAKILVCGGIAGVATWASIFPLDVIKTRVQTQELTTDSSLQRGHASQRQTTSNEDSALINHSAQRAKTPLKGAWEIARQAYCTEGLRVFFRGIGVCCARAFVVNAVQWSVYEEVMKVIAAEGT